MIRGGRKHELAVADSASGPSPRCCRSAPLPWYCHVPDPQYATVDAEQQSAVRRENDAIGMSVHTRIRFLLLAGLSVLAHWNCPSPPGDEPIIRREGDAVNDVRVPIKSLELLARFGFPQSQGLVLTAGQDPLAGVGKCRVVNAVAVSRELLHFIPVSRSHIRIVRSYSAAMPNATIR